LDLQHIIGEFPRSEQEALLFHKKSKIALVLANGPSAKMVDFKHKLLRFVATIGMNSAFRHWYNIDFRPTYYICMDIEVIHTISADIFNLINENRIKKFFLRDEIKEIYPELAGHKRIYWYSQARAHGGIFSGKFVTTGSWAIRWMIHEEMNLIATIGIDGVQTEILPEARRLGEGSDIRLEIVSTPMFNPNYYFSDYQKKGDKFNIPNSPEYTRKNGNLFHIDALKAVVEGMIREDIKTKIIDLSPISNHGVFEKSNLAAWFKKVNLSLVTTFHGNNDKDVLEKNFRVAIANCLNPFISQVHILFEGARQDFGSALPSNIASKIKELEAAGNLQIIAIDERPSYKQLFEYANSKSLSSSCIVTNSDIFMPFSTAEDIVINRFSSGEPLYALTRWNLPSDVGFPQGMSPPPAWWHIELDDLSIVEKNVQSSDTYVFDLPLQIPCQTDRLLVGSFGCGTALTGIFRVFGYDVSNPCLQYKTVHFDVKYRDYDSRAAKDSLQKNINSLRDSILSRYSVSPPIIQSIDNIKQLNCDVAWIGSYNTEDIWRSLFSTVGAVPWSNISFTPSFQFKKLTISQIDLETGKVDASLLVKEMEKNNVFLEWELSSFKKEDHIAKILLCYKDYEKLGESLKSYPWQSMIHTDKVAPEIRGIHFDNLLVVRDILGGKIAGQLASTARKHGIFDFIGVFSSDNTPIQFDRYALRPPSKDNHIMCRYKGYVRLGDIAVSNVAVTLDNDCTLRFILCRDGDGPFESSAKLVRLKKGRHSVTLMHQFKNVHFGLRIQIGVEDCQVTISDLRLDLKLDISENFGTSSKKNEQKKTNAQQPRPGRTTIDTIPTEKVMDEEIVILDPDGKNIRGHFIAYCDQLMGFYGKVGIKAQVWCREDIDPILLQSRSNFFPLFSIHSWTIASNEDKFFTEIEKGIIQRAAQKKPITMYLYTGSFYHSRVFMRISQKYPHIRFHCNLFWEMIRDIDTPVYKKLAEDVFRALEKQGNFTLTVPTIGLQEEFFAQYGIKLSVAPHPSTAVSDDQFEQIQSHEVQSKIGDSNGKIFNVLIPGAATQSKGYEVGLEVARLLSVEKGIVCWMRDENKGELPSGVKIIPDNLPSVAFNELLQTSDAIVLPYMPDGFRRRTSGIIIDAMYLGAPVVVCEDTWLGDIVNLYGTGVVAPPTPDGLYAAVLRIKSEHDRYRSDTRKAAQSYFQKNTWERLGRSLLPMSSNSSSTVEAYQPFAERQSAFGIANRLLREGSYTAAMERFILLSESSPLKMYEDNALMCAKKMGLEAVDSFQDLKDHLIKDTTFQSRCGDKVLGI
jgi:glycosyltransferase involved in cell wall biosynthesis